ncbi:MAG: Ig-like domain-containing protein [Armatimonadetes bacterium]|nr:Ig-like domain-containing protein [Armatimonadota bacterium]
MIVKWRVCILAATAMLLAVFVMGCGGSSGRLTGSISFTVEWPEPVVKSRLVPQATLSVRAEACQGGVKVGEAVLVRPSDDTPSSPCTIEDVPQGETTLTLHACPNADGTGTPLASGSMVLTVARGQTAQAQITMNSTISEIEVQPPTVTLSPGATMQLTASPRNSEGDLVLVAESSLTWGTSDAGVADVGKSGMVTAVAAGQAEITVTDSESGKSAKVTVSVAVSVAGAADMAGRAPDVNSGYEDGGILVIWNSPAGISSSDIIEYHVWRNDHGTYFTTGGTMSTVGLALAPDQATASARTTPLGSFDHSAVDDMLPRTFNYAYANEQHALASGSQVSLGLTPGVPHQYWVSCLYTRRTITSGGTEVVTYWETDPVSAGRATFLLRPAPESPGGTTAQDYEDLTNITFQWRGSGGADEYVIEISTSPDFRRNETWVDVIYQPTSQDGQLFSKTYTNVLKNADTGQVVSELANVPAGGTLFWRVGARNRADKPGPYPAGPSPLVSGAKNTRYIYSDQSMVYMFMTLTDMSGPPPDDGGDDGTTRPPPPPL